MPAWRIGICGSLLALLATPAMGGDDALQLTPSGSWTAEFADDSCAVRRLFENEGERVLLEFRSYVPGLSRDAVIASDTLSLRPRSVQSSFAPSGGTQSHEFYRSLRFDTGWNAIIFPEASIKPETNASTYTVSGAFNREVNFANGSFSAVFSMMESCEDDLLTSLGIDAVAHKTLSRRVELPRNDGWLSVTGPMQRDFHRKGSEMQYVRLLVDEQGNAFDCLIVEGGTDKDTSDRMCTALLKSARFVPALDAQSDPVKSYYMLVLSTSRRAGFSSF